MTTFRNAMARSKNFVPTGDGTITTLRTMCRHTTDDAGLGLQGGTMNYAWKPSL
ncbi:MAG: hypothetical protein MUF23_14235 [Pirellula sp.]|nr:hypothetical protein [Pirellula sp.]